MYEIKTEDVYKDFSNDKEMFDFSNYSTESKYYDNSNKLVVGKMKDETACVAIEELVGLKPKMYSYLVDDKSEDKKAKGVNRNIVATISHNKYKGVLLNKKSLRHSMNRIQSKDHRIGIYEISKISLSSMKRIQSKDDRIRIYEINKISLSCFDDKIYIQNNGYDGLALGY